MKNRRTRRKVKRRRKNSRRSTDAFTISKIPE
jgi:hypothetical protein